MKRPGWYVFAAVVLVNIAVASILPPVGSLAIRDPREVAALAIFDLLAIAIAFVVQTRGARRRDEIADERRRFAAQVELERARLRNIISSVPGVVWEAWGKPDAASQRIDFVSDHVESMLGYTVQEWLSTPNFWLTIVHPDDRETAAMTAAEHWTRGGTGVNTFRWVAKDGRVLWVEGHSMVLTDDDGRPVGMRGVTMDITSRKRAEESLRLLSEASALLATSLDYEITLRALVELTVQRMADLCIIDMLAEDGSIRRLAVAHRDHTKERAVAAMMKYAPNSTSSPSFILEAIRYGTLSVRQDLPIEMLKSYASSEEHAEALEILGIRSAVIAPLRARGRNFGAISFGRSTPNAFDELDIELAQLLARRAAIAVDNAQLYRTAIDASRAKDEFLATVSHELRTPMTATLGWVRMLLRGELDEETQKVALEAIERSTYAQAKLIDDILDVSRIIMGKFQLEPGPVDLPAVIDAAIATVQPATEAKNITIDVDTRGWTGVVKGDAARLQQVVWNMVSNAIKFGHRDGRVQVTLRRTGQLAQLTIRDDGTGIEPHFLPHVFERFRQAESGTTRRYGGLGLGLAIVRHLVELHGGSVRAASDGPGRGSTFTIELPVAEASHSAEPLEAPPALPSLIGRRILVVDDEVSTLDLLSTILRECGAKVTSAASADEAMIALNREHHDVLVTDIAMPGEDGVSLLHRARLTTGRKPIPAIAVTALSDFARDGLFDRVLRKPIDPVALARAVAETIA